MADYLRPPRTAAFGRDGVPSLILGDNGFLRRYGSTLTITDIAARIRHALDRADLGIGAGDERVLRAARRARAPWVLHHTDIAFTADGRRAHFGRSMATLHALLAARAPQFAAADPLMGRFLAGYRAHTPYPAGARLTRDDAATERTAERIRAYRPAMTTVGGDHLDALLALGAFDAARRTVEPVLDACHRSGSVPVLTTYLAGLLDERGLAGMAEGFAGVMAPLNEAGAAMPPDRETATASLRRLGKPVIAMHVLAAGALEPGRALRHVLHTEQAAAAIVGASSPDHIAHLIKAARAAFEGVEIR